MFKPVAFDVLQPLFFIFWTRGAFSQHIKAIPVMIGQYYLFWTQDIIWQYRH